MKSIPEIAEETRRNYLSISSDPVIAAVEAQAAAIRVVLDAPIEISARGEPVTIRQMLAGFCNKTYGSTTGAFDEIITALTGESHE